MKMQRSAVTSTVGNARGENPEVGVPENHDLPRAVVSRTAAATAARQRAAAERAAVRLGVEQLSALPDSHLLALVAALLGEVERRGGLGLKV